MNTTPPLYSGTCVEDFAPLSKAALSDFERWAHQFTVSPIAHSFEGQLDAWYQVRQQLKAAIQPAHDVPLRTQRTLLKQFRALEQHHLRFELRKKVADYFRNADHWPHEHSNDHTHWQRHAAYTHWSVSALMELVNTLLPYIEQYLQQSEQCLAHAPTALSPDIATNFKTYLAQLRTWFNQQQQAVAFALLARLQTAQRYHGAHADCLYALARKWQAHGMQSPSLARLTPEISFDPSSALPCFYRYLSQFSTLHPELQALHWFQPYPNWQLTTDAHTFYWLPTTLHHALSKQPQRRLLPKRWQRTTAWQWCQAHQSLWLTQRYLTLPPITPPPTLPALATQFDRYQTQQQQIQRAQISAKQHQPSRWNWFYRHTRNHLQIAQQTLTTFEQHNTQTLHRLCQQWVTILYQQPWDTMQETDFTTLLSALATRQATANPNAQQELQHWQQHVRQRQTDWRTHQIVQQWQHALQQILHTQTATLDDWITAWRSHQALHAVDPTQAAQLIQHLQPAYPQLQQTLLDQLASPETATTEPTSSQPLIELTQLLLTLGNDAQRQQLNDTLHQRLYALCQQTLSQQPGATQRQHQLQQLSQLTGTSVAPLAAQWLETSRTHYQALQHHMQRYMDQTDARHLLQQRTQACERFTHWLTQRLIANGQTDPNTHTLFFDCCEQMIQGKPFALILATTRQRIDWLANQQALKQWLLLAVHILTVLNDPELSQQPTHALAQWMRQLTSLMHPHPPTCSLFTPSPSNHEIPSTPSAPASPGVHP